MTNRRSTPTPSTHSRTSPAEIISGLTRSLRKKRKPAGTAENLGETIGRGLGHFVGFRTGRHSPAPRLCLVDRSVFAQVARVAPDLPIVKRAIRHSSLGTVVTVMVGIGVVVWTGRKLKATDLVKELAMPMILHAVHGATRLALPLLAVDLIVSMFLLAGSLPHRSRPKNPRAEV